MTIKRLKTILVVLQVIPLIAAVALGMATAAVRANAISEDAIIAAALAIVYVPYLASVVLSGVLASRLRRSVLGWVLATFFLPLFGPIILVTRGSLDRPVSTGSRTGPGRPRRLARACPRGAAGEQDHPGRCFQPGRLLQAMPIGDDRREARKCPGSQWDRHHPDGYPLAGEGPASVSRVRICGADEMVHLRVRREAARHLPGHLHEERPDGVALLREEAAPRRRRRVAGHRVRIPELRTVVKERKISMVIRNERIWLFTATMLVVLACVLGCAVPVGPDEPADRTGQRGRGEPG